MPTWPNRPAEFYLAALADPDSRMRRQACAALETLGLTMSFVCPTSGASYINRCPPSTGRLVPSAPQRPGRTECSAWEVSGRLEALLPCHPD